MTTRGERLLADLGFTWNDCMEAWEWVMPMAPIILIMPHRDPDGEYYTVHSMKWLHGWDDHGRYDDLTTLLTHVQGVIDA